ncbi:reverse transcriptase [Gossypium australe]|uniref:Reverse transcriptase n=1 Tax=Gossypium australe TaxID=47621 RepID=A0A5B6W4C7_9ROSI|nr:reverse transcriptase [Gossypium australe]
MKILCWNVRCLRSLWAIWRLQHMLKIYRLQIVFLMVTKLNAGRMEKVQRRCGFHNSFEVTADGTRRRLSLGWNDGQLVRLRSFSKTHIDIEIYGDNVETWNLLRTLGRCSDVPWLVGGKFNDILYAFEKNGGLPRDEGPWFTWETSNVKERNIRERIDKGVATSNWVQLFLNFSLCHLLDSFSNHCLLFIQMEHDDLGRKKKDEFVLKHNGL